MKTILFLVLLVLASVISIDDTFADHSEVTIVPAAGSGAPGCEESAEGCYIPNTATVDVGGKVIFSNTDTAAHTFTAGIAGSPSGEFDTSLVIAGSSYEWTPTTVGEFPYYCMVHPWMEGTITVLNSNVNIDTKIVTLPVMVGDKKFTVTSKTTDVSITKISADVDFVSVILDVKTTGNPGILEITFDRNFFDSTFQGKDDSFIILVDGDEPKHSEIKTDLLSRTLRIELPFGTQRVEIIGSNFGSFMPKPVEKFMPNPIPPTNELSDGTKVLVSTSPSAKGEKTKISIEFEDSEHVNYDIKVIQNGNEVLNHMGVHHHDGSGVHETVPLKTTDPLEITVTFQGYGIDDPKTGPIGEKIFFSSNNILPITCPSGQTLVNGKCVLKPTPIPPDDLQHEIKIIPTSGSGAPGCENTAAGCYIPKSASVAVGGKVIFSNTDTAAHTFTAGTAADGPSGIFDTSLVIAGSSYEWTATTSGKIPYYCMVHPWMEATIFVGDNPYPIPEPTPNPVLLNLVIDPTVYDIGNTVSLKMSLDGVSSPHDIGIDVSDNTGKTIISRTITTSSSGAATLDLKIAENFKAGNYKVVATTSVDGNTLKASASFIVKSQYNQFKITSVQSTNQQGNPAPLKAGELGFIKVSLESNKSISTLVTVNLFDSELTSIGIGSIKTTLSSGNSEIILSFMIPKDAALGPADIYVNAFSDWPSNNGVPLTKEFAIQENIQ